MEKDRTDSKYTIPASIIIAGALIAGALWASGNQTSQPVDNQPEGPSLSDISVREVSVEDHIAGNPDARITLIEYSDFECPFCGQFHPTLERIVSENSDVRWVYRHFPLNNIHSQATPSAIASECIAEIAGNEAFWQFAGSLFENQSSLGRELYISEAAEFGIAESDMLACMESEEMQQKVADDLDEARSTGGTGTPHTLVLVGDEVLATLPGALPYESANSILDQIRTEI